MPKQARNTNHRVIYPEITMFAPPIHSTSYPFSPCPTLGSGFREADLFGCQSSLLFRFWLVVFNKKHWQKMTWQS
jgi:hypothetical protein